MDDNTILEPGRRSSTDGNLSAPKTIRTYEGDIVNAMTRKGTSTIEIAMAEKRKETGTSNLITNKEPTDTGKKSFLAILSLLLIGIGVVGAYYLYRISPLAPAPIEIQQTKIISLIPSDTQTTVSVDNLTELNITRKLQSQIDMPQEAETIREIIPYTTDSTGGRNRISAQEMLQKMDIPVPDILARSLTPSWMLGVYADKNGDKNVFVVATNNFFQNAFAGMLSWESVMADDLKQYLYPASALSLSVASTTQMSFATSTGSTTNQASSTVIQDQMVIPFFTLRGQFTDKIVKNKDVREYITANGDTLFLYSFVDNSKLVITRNKQTLTEILTRLEKKAFVR